MFRNTTDNCVKFVGILLAGLEVEAVACVLEFLLIHHFGEFMFHVHK